MRKIGQDERSAVMLLYPMMANFLVMACLMPFVYRPMAAIDLGGLGLMAVLGFAGGLCIIAAYRIGRAVVVAPMQYSQILWAVIYGYLFFGEVPDTRHGAGRRHHHPLAASTSSSARTRSRRRAPGRCSAPARASSPAPIRGSAPSAGCSAACRRGRCAELPPVCRKMNNLRLLATWTEESRPRYVAGNAMD